MSPLDHSQQNHSQQNHSQLSLPHELSTLASATSPPPPPSSFPKGVPKDLGHFASNLAIATQQQSQRAPSWSLELLCGRFIELSTQAEQGAISFASTLIREAQQQGELAAWIGTTQSCFYPPDMMTSGIDLEQFPVIAVENLKDVPRATEALLRSGAFALLILDIGFPGFGSRGFEERRYNNDSCLPLPLQTRLAGLAKSKRTTVLALTHKHSREGSLGSLVSVRAHSQRRSIGEGRFACELQVLKDKRFGPCWGSTELRCGPLGLC